MQQKIGGVDFIKHEKKIIIAFKIIFTVTIALQLFVGK
jgi:hypothetical protein